MGDSVKKEKAREEIRNILQECATEGTVWNRHLRADDTIDIWREMNGVLQSHLEEPISFDVFYASLDRFKRAFKVDFEEAIEVFLKIMEPKPEPAEAEARRTRRRAASNTRRPATQRMNVNRASSITHATARLRRPA
jgi:hypothetical protein